jgi:hypothetical protein
MLDSRTLQKLANHSSVYANRMLHPASNTIIIGPYVIDAARNVRSFESLLDVRVGGMAEHIVSPDTMVYMLGMDGPLWECNVYTLACTQLFNLVVALNIPAAAGEQPHFKVSGLRGALPFKRIPHVCLTTRVLRFLSDSSTGCAYDEWHAVRLQQHLRRSGWRGSAAWGAPRNLWVWLGQLWPCVAGGALPSGCRGQSTCAVACNFCSAGDGNIAHNWTILEQTAFVEVTGR